MKLHDLGVVPGASVIIDTIDLEDGWYWVDEQKWSYGVAKPTHTLTGGLVIEMAKKLIGRPITLQPQDDMGWVTRVVAEQLRAWSETPLRRMKLVLEYPTDTREFIVVFRHQDNPVELEAVKKFPAHEDADLFNGVLRFTEVE